MAYLRLHTEGKWTSANKMADKNSPWEMPAEKGLIKNYRWIFLNKEREKQNQTMADVNGLIKKQIKKKY